MTRGERWILDISNLLVGGTGLVYAVMKYLMESKEQWSVVNHPWQPQVQHLHILMAPILVFAGALIWKAHASRKLRDPALDGRLTGLGLGVQFVPLVVSGYLIQVSVSEFWRNVWVLIHLTTGGLWILLFVIHRSWRYFAVTAESPAPGRAASEGHRRTMP